MTAPMASATPDASGRSSVPPASGGSGDGQELPAAVASEPVLCGHCGRTASNGLVCQGICVADSGY
ncbi:MAG: hypothetical protein WCF98_11460 [Synechococcus sp. ELA057]